jgi:hypothetical protein
MTRTPGARSVRARMSIGAILALLALSCAGAARGEPLRTPAGIAPASPAPGQTSSGEGAGAGAQRGAAAEQPGPRQGPQPPGPAGTAQPPGPGDAAQRPGPPEAAQQPGPRGHEATTQVEPGPAGPDGPGGGDRRTAGAGDAAISVPSPPASSGSTPGAGEAASPEVPTPSAQSAATAVGSAAPVPGVTPASGSGAPTAGSGASSASAAEPAAAVPGTTGTQPSSGSSAASSPSAGGSTGSGTPSSSGGSGGGHTRSSSSPAHGRGHRARSGGGGQGGGGRPAAPRATRSGGLGASSVAGGVTAGAAAASGGGATHAAHARHTSQRPSAPAPTALPVVRTVERIVGVVPASVWIMIGVLALLSVAFAASSWGVALRARRLARQRRRLAEDIGLLQAALLPAVPEHIGPLRASVAYRPAEGPAAGGDFYDLFQLADGRVAVIVGDVSGHGRTALPQTALIRYTLRTYLDSGLAPRAALAAAGAALEHQLEDDCYATVALALYDPQARTLAYACAGHPPPLVLAPGPIPPVLASSSPPIGLGLRTGLRQTVLSLPADAEICLFTDGVVEARRDGELFGVGRLARALAELGPRASAERLLARVVELTDRRPDDMAACLLVQEGAAPAANGAPVAPPARVEELQLDAAELHSPRPARFLRACGLSAQDGERALRSAHAAVADGGGALLRILIEPPHADGATPIRVEVGALPARDARALAANAAERRAARGLPLGSPLAT